MSGRRMGHRRIKGPIFPSMRNQSTEPKKILVWTPGTQSTRQVKRNLRNRVRHIIDSKDETTIAVGDRVIRAVCAEPDPEYSALHLFCAALDASEQTGESWTTCMTYLMDKFDHTTPDAAEETPHGEDDKKPEGSQGGSFIRRLLRSIAPSTHRQSNEAAPAANVDQSSGAGPAHSEGQNATNFAFGNRESPPADEASDPRRV